ncbi:hypothetical protein Btru_041213 [Bulinus truncatus]|nr:hypothetical protein Btru_041213 [Bulinus truncatus]
MVEKDTWVDCPSGYFLAGLGGVGKWREDDNILDFSKIVAVRCMKPAGHPIYYGDCYSEETVKCFTQNNTCSCKAGHYVTGMYKSSGKEFKSLESMRCCSMAPKPKEAPTFSALKTGIMEKTLRHLAVLADGLGFSYSRGNGLKIEYGNWSLGVRDIKYGQTDVNTLSPEIIDSGMINNLASSQVTENLDISKTVQETITHKVWKCFSTSPGLAVEFNFDIPLPGKESLKYRSEVELSDSDDTKTSTIDTRTLQSKLSIILQPNSAVNYKVILKKSKTIIPYTAVIAVKFSTEFKGYLKWGRSKLIPFANNHYLHKGIEHPFTLSIVLAGNLSRFIPL